MDSRDRYISPYTEFHTLFFNRLFLLASNFFFSFNNPFKKSLRTEATAVHCMKLVVHWRRQSPLSDGFKPSRKEHYQSYTIC